MTKKPIALIILDGWGERSEQTNNPTKNVKTPTIDALYRDYPHISLEASGQAVGLPDGQMGNSEVGHLHLGAGRKLPQDLVRINNAIENNELSKNPVLIDAIKTAKNKQSAIHVIGLLSPGGVHSHEDQLYALIKLIGANGIQKNYLHALLDGRDTPPCSAKNSLKRFDDLFKTLPGGKIASLIGRYYGMDRDKRWDRIQKAYDLLTLGASEYKAKTAEEALSLAYARNETDEFVIPTMITSDGTATTIQNDDVVIFMNFRADRARQLTQAFVEDNFTGFSRKERPKLSAFVTLTQYIEHPDLSVAFPPLSIKNTLGEYIANHGLSQLRIAETEKYAHVTYFFNGGLEPPFPNEDRLLIPSPKVATYDLQPEMSAYALTDQLIEAIESEKYDLIICNYANPDMVGHTGKTAAAEKAVHVIDQCLSRVLNALSSLGGEACITADHGNIEQMYDDKHEQPHTAHTTNLVPFIYVGRPAKATQAIGALDDVAPTVLYLLGLTQPTDMTGNVLLQLEKMA